MLASKSRKNSVLAAGGNLVLKSNFGRRLTYLNLPSPLTPTIHASPTDIPKQGLVDLSKVFAGEALVSQLRKREILFRTAST